MKKTKKRLCFALAAVMLLGTVGCSTKEQKDDNTTLTWLVPLSEQPDGQSVEDAISAITKEKIGAAVDLQYIDTAAYKERMTMNMASGSVFDLCFSGYLNPYEDGVRNGGFYELDELLDKTAPALKKALPDYAWEAATVNDHIYGVPNMQCLAAPRAVSLNMELAKKYNFDTSAIKTIEDVEPFLKIIKENEPTKIPYRINYVHEMWTSTVYDKIINDIVIRSDGSTTKVEYLFDTPEYKRAYEVLHDWYKKGYIREDLLSAGSDVQDYNAGKYAVAQGRALPGASEEMSVKMGTEWKLIPISPAHLDRSSAITALTSIGATSKHPEEAIKLIELVNTDAEIFNLLKLGIKDRHYTLDAEGKYSLIDGSGYKGSGGWVFGSEYNSILAAGQADDTMIESEKINNEAQKSPVLGFVLNKDNIKTEISQVTAIMQEFGSARRIVYGMDESYAEMMSKLKEAGIDKIRDEVQKQVDEYFAKQ